MNAPASLAHALADRYRIERELGAGGMATVYLAEDLKHDRRVAVKVLRPELAAVIGAERFLAEIKTTANLQHPHILPLFDSGAADGFLFYVMPYVEGESLRDRLNREKQLPVADAVRIASEVASALDYAHRHGIIHRDIKPENVLLHDGRALVADFGIALAASKSGGTRMTETGMSLGTPHYMSPEQAMGEREITARSDVYALGCITYEMLAGEPPFTGPTAQAIIARVMTEEPRSLGMQRRTIPPGVDAAVLTAIQKLPADRYASAAEFAAALANPASTAATMIRPGVTHAFPATRRGRLTAVAALAAVGAASLVAGLLLGRRHQPAAPAGASQVVHATISLGDSVRVRAIGNLRLALSPDGRRIAFVGPDGGGTALWIRDLAQPAPRKLADTRGAFAPFFSPDGESVGYFAVDNGHVALKVVGATGGVSHTVLTDSIASFGGGSWADDGRIYFTNASRGLSSVPASGGALKVVTRADTTHGVKEHDYPDVLPGSRYAVVMLWKGSVAINRVGLVNIATGAVTDLMEGTSARYAAPGLIISGAADGRLLAAPFDLAGGRLTGPAMVVLKNVQREGSNGTSQFAVSATGTLVYLEGVNDNASVMWVDRTGQQTPVDSALTGVLQDVALSPDGTRLAVGRAEAGETSVWVDELATGALSRLSVDVSGADRPVWTPDGRAVAFLATRDGHRTAWVRRADGSNDMQPAVSGSAGLDEIAFDPLGRYTLLRSEGTAAGTRHILVLQNGKDTVPRLLINSRFDHFAPALSPDGQWLAYVSAEAGAPQVYVRPFPNVDSARFAISAGGGIEPLWSRDGKELFYRDARGGMMAVATGGPHRFQPGVPRLLFRNDGLALQDFYRSYDVTPDGKRFVMVKSGGSDAGALTIIFNWRQELAAIARGAPAGP